MSSRTYQDELRRRTESKPVQVIDYSKLDKSVAESVDKSVEKTIDKVADKLVDKSINPWNKKYVPSYVCIFIHQSLY